MQRIVYLMNKIYYIIKVSKCQHLEVFMFITWLGQVYLRFDTPDVLIFTHDYLDHYDPEASPAFSNRTEKKMTFLPPRRCGISEKTRKLQLRGARP